MGLEDVSKYPALFAELLRRGYSDNDIAKISRLNIIRVLREAEAVCSLNLNHVQISTPTLYICVHAYLHR